VWQRVLLLVCAVTGLCVLLYPPTATWLTAHAQSRSIAAYAEQSRAAAPRHTQELLTAARAYNRSLPDGTLRDPYSTDADGTATDTTPTDDYLRQLRLSATDVMAQVAIPAIHASLPIYHGTAHDTLDRGAGHLFGSSLPVGGSGTHAVITAHSGLPQSTMFTDLVKVRRGDLFAITVLGQTLTYKVDQIKIVKPGDPRELAIVPGKDYATLVTCTPLYVNSHRLLVRGERVPTPTEMAQRVSASSGPGFPWWLVVLLAVPSGLAAILFAPRRTTRTRRDHGAVPPSAVG
jgi:sortase A